MSTNYFVYCYYDLNDNPIYVGMGSRNRHLSHLVIVQAGGKLKNPRLERKIAQILRANALPKIEKLCEGLTQQQAKELEIEYIAKFGRLDLNRGTLYNLTRGGDGLCEWSDEQRAHLSNLRKNKINVKDQNGKKFVVDKDDARFISGELCGQNAGITFKDTDKLKGYIQCKNLLTGESARLKTNDPRLLDEGWVGIKNGTNMSAEAKKKISESMKQHIKNNPRGKKCTVDGIEFFNSLKELTAKYGKGCRGSRHPNFRYV